MSNRTRSERKLFACGYNGFAQLPLKGDTSEQSRAVLYPQQCAICPQDSHLIHCLAVGWSRCCIKKGKEICLSGHPIDHNSRKSITDDVDNIGSIHCFDGRLFTTVSTSSNVLVETCPTKLEVLKVKDQDERDVKVIYLDSDVNNLFALTGEDAGKLERSEKGFIYKTIFNNGQVDALSCGKEHVLFLTRAGVVFSFGAGSRGQLGHGIVQDKLEEPTQVDAIAAVPIKAIAAGGWHSVVISEYGDLYIWGWNVNGQLGFPKQFTKESPDIPSSPAAKRKRCSTTEEAHQHQRTASSPKSPKEAPFSEDKDLAEGDSLAVSFLTSPQILDMSPPEEILVKSASCGSRHTAAVTRDGRLYTWGFGQWGQLGHGDQWTQDHPIRVESFSDNAKVIEVYCREWNTFILVEDNTT